MVAVLPSLSDQAVAAPLTYMSALITAVPAKQFAAQFVEAGGASPANLHRCYLWRYLSLCYCSTNQILLWVIKKGNSFLVQVPAARPASERAGAGNAQLRAAGAAQPGELPSAGRGAPRVPSLRKRAYQPELPNSLAEHMHSLGTGHEPQYYTL